VVQPVAREAGAVTILTSLIMRWAPRSRLSFLNLTQVPARHGGLVSLPSDPRITSGTAVIEDDGRGHVSGKTRLSVQRGEDRALSHVQLGFPRDDEVGIPNCGFVKAGEATRPPHKGSSTVSPNSDIGDRNVPARPVIYGQIHDVGDSFRAKHNLGVFDRDARLVEKMRSFYSRG
jgi:hypothetical protein